MFALLVALALALGDTETPVDAAVPAGVDLSQPRKLVRVSDGVEIPYQLIPGSTPHAVRFLHRQDLSSKEKTAYRFEAGAPKASPNVEVANDGSSLLVRAGDRKLFQYRHAVVSTPGVDAVFDRSGFLHPIWTPDGRILTNNSPANHLHHHGLWTAWTSSEFEGRKSNFWESKERQGRIECVGVSELVSGPVFASFKAKHRWINLNGPDGPKPALDEEWTVRASVVNGGLDFIFDVDVRQTCAGSSPLVIKEYRYGGIGFRGSPEWEGKAGVEVRTSEGKTRIDGHATRATWCVMSGRIDGKPASIGFLSHPSNFRAPEPMRIHPDEPFFNWAVPQGGDLSIEPGKPFSARYRFVVSASLPDLVLQADWQAYAGQAAVEIVR